MTGDIARLDLRLRRRSTLAYSLGFLAYAVLIVALYPSFKHDTGLEQLTRHNPTLSALFGAAGSLTSPEGWMNANLYSNFVPLFALLMTIGYGAWAIAGQDEDLLLGPVAAQPIQRHRLLAEKIAALGVLALPIAAVTLAADLLGPTFDLHLSTGGILAVTIGTVLMSWDFGLLALAVGTWTGRRGTALGIAVTLAAASYIITSLAPVVDAIHPLRFASLIYWSLGHQQLSDGLHPADGIVLVAVGVMLIAVAHAGLRRLDIH
jgi:ABC-2 type transport system permease protein